MTLLDYFLIIGLMISLFIGVHSYVRHKAMMREYEMKSKTRYETKKEAILKQLDF